MGERMNGMLLHREYDLIIIGGGLGGCAAAMAAVRRGLRVLMTEETDWIGGQLTSQAVPPDEHRWIESFGCTRSYRTFRERVRAYYRDHYPLTDEARNNPTLNPGSGWVSHIAHEPRVALRVLEDMLAPFVNSGKLTLLLEHQPVQAEVEGDTVKSVTVASVMDGSRIRLEAPMFLDATETGELLPLAGIEHVTGAESRDETGEPHALSVADPLDMQSITHVVAVDYVEGGNFTIEKPAMYEVWKEYIPSFSDYSILSWQAMDPDDTTVIKAYTMFPNDQGIVSLWDYRMILNPAHLADGSLYEGSLTLLNWPQNDYYVGPIIGVTEEEKRYHLEGARQLSLSLVYWLQTEAPRLDGGFGYPGVRLRGDVLGTEDGLAKAAYIRESRRIRALYTITENDVSREIRGDQGILRYADSVGVGSYHLDLHPTTVSQRGFYIPSYPYEIPLGSLIPVRVTNVLPACKNIGTTQISNGCYRLHPTEWNIGEAVGYLAAYALQNGLTAREVRENNEHLKSYQQWLTDAGVEMHWPDEMVV
ncbi:FAD-dependent oxidoreductase [Paenibacillus roseipurpureus]|uniref:FAD-dependent oxidoreductase n=1 Tax=Paenibacillus roseopurpureus TaxID=2918901 RepID=A0AA96LU53_9BACL|nr:FAD-dependent oxidoreductase [Paenibacillus sp. MBLB1832]WNR46134.1 FAD-dependent oxidoreductase [Paenibacillus sp. MBLB1832]